MTVLQVKNLRKAYTENDIATVALNGVSFSVEKGEFVAITGASGSGKSTLLHLIAGVEAPSSGQTILEGRNIYNLGDDELAVLRRRNIGIVYQFFNLISLLSVEENVLLPQLLDSRIPNKEKLDEILELVDLSDKRGHFPCELSGGEQQQVSIARALINSPAIILADEPTGNLDSKTGRAVMDLFNVANKHYGQTLIMVTHDENLALQADRIIAMKDGQIISDERVR